MPASKRYVKLFTKEVQRVLEDENVKAFLLAGFVGDPHASVNANSKQLVAESLFLLLRHRLHKSRRPPETADEISDARSFLRAVFVILFICLLLPALWNAPQPMGTKHAPSVATAGILWTPFQDSARACTFTNLAKKRVRVKMCRIAQMRPTSADARFKFL